MTLIVMSLVIPWPGADLNATDPGPRAEYLLKAAFLYNIAKFVEWPDNENTTITVCLTNDAFGATIDSITGKSVQGRPIAVKYAATPQSVRRCHMVFVDMQEGRRGAEFLEALAGEPILTICDQPDCAQRGVMINLQRRDEKIGLEMNLAAIQRTRLKLSSQLLKLARIINEEHGKP